MTVVAWESPWSLARVRVIRRLRQSAPLQTSLESFGGDVSKNKLDNFCGTTILRKSTTMAPFSWLSEDLVLQVLIRVRQSSQGAAAATCKSFSEILGSPTFASSRRAAGYEERALFFWERHLFRPRLLANDGGCWRCPRLPLDGALRALPFKGSVVAVCRPRRPSVCDHEFATVVLDLRRKRWRLIEEGGGGPYVEKTIGVSYLAAATVGDKIFAITTNYRQRLSTFDGHKWTLLRGLTMPMPVVEAALVGVLEGLLGEETTTTSSSRHDLLSSLENNDESPRRIRRRRRRRETVVVIGGRLAHFARGEVMSTMAVDAVQALDTETLRWRNLAPLPESRCRAAACVRGESIYVVGGFTSFGPEGVNVAAETTLVLDSLDSVAWRVLAEAKLPASRRRRDKPVAACVVHPGSLGDDHIFLYTADDRALSTVPHGDPVRVEPPLVLPLTSKKSCDFLDVSSTSSFSSSSSSRSWPDSHSWVSFDDQCAADDLLGAQSGLVKNHLDLVDESTHIADDQDIARSALLEYEPPAARTPYVHPCVASVVLG